MKILTVLIIFLTMIIGGCGSSPSASGNNELELAIRDASDYLNDNIPEGSMIVILNMQSDSAALSDYIIDELIANALNDKIFKVVDRQQLDLIRTEQNFQLSGEVDDKLAQSIGKFFGAQTIVSGRIRQLDNRYRMTIRALEVQTAQVQGQYNRNIAAGKTITSLMRSGGGSSGGNVTTSRTTGSGNSTTGTTGGTATRIVPTVISVAVSPDTVSVSKGKIHQFSATITGTNNPEPTVTWTVTGNTSRGTSISENGVLVVAADEVATPLTVTATSTVDTDKNGSATVAVPGGISAINVSSVANWNTAINTIRNGGDNKTYIINITSNISVPPTENDGNIFGSVMGITVTIQGSGTLSLSANGELLHIGTGQTVTVKNITLRGRTGNTRSLINVQSGGIFNLEGTASITGNTYLSSVNWNRVYGSGVYVGGTFNMRDSASVTNNVIAKGENSYSYTSTEGGGGVGVGRGGTFIMQDSASVTGNTATGKKDFNSSERTGGGGVYINGGTFTMRGNATVRGNTAAVQVGSGSRDISYGGGVYVNGGTFTMQDNASVINNTAERTGGVSLDSGGNFTMQGGTISHNTGSIDIGGVWIGDGGTFTMREGIITRNTSGGSCGGVGVNGATFTMQGGTISGNTVSGNGGGVGVANANFTKTGGTIGGSDATSDARNTAQSQGQALYWWSNPDRWRNATAGPNDNTAGYGFWLND